MHAPHFLEPGTEFRFEFPAKFGVGRLKLGVPGHKYPAIKGRWLILFLNFEFAKLNSFDLSLVVLQIAEILKLNIDGAPRAPHDLAVYWEQVLEKYRRQNEEPE